MICYNILLFLLSLLLFSNIFKNVECEFRNNKDEHFTNEWAVKIPGGLMAANHLAKTFGYQNQGTILGFNDVYLMKKADHPKRSKRHAIHQTTILTDQKEVLWAEQQVARKRVKREFVSLQERKNRTHKPRSHLGLKKFNDELWSHEWYLHDTKSFSNQRLDLGVSNVWDMGLTGRGVVVTIMDDGIEWNHTDIFPNYDRRASYDANDNDDDPFPRYDKYDSNSHGTRCAGEVAMVANNGKCGVGVAYNARIGGIRCLDGDVSDVIEAISISFGIHHIDIYSSSWGPNDDGATVDGPKRLAIEALYKGVTEGRNGKGCIYVWASGNGGMKGDNCNCDGYASSIYTISIGSASQSGQFPWYGEKCSSTLAVTYSSGSYSDQKISTTDLHDKCTIDHSGTSAAAPLAAGILALALEANPHLTWRDVQHLVAYTSDFTSLMDNKGWKRNAAGFMYNSRFGFGLIDAEYLVTAAIKWKTVPKKHACYILPISKLPATLNSGDEIQINFLTDGCKHTDQEINFIEHTQIILDLEHTKRGCIDVWLISPSGTATMLLSRRPKDSSIMGFRNWTLTSVHCWSENPTGQWTLMIRDKHSKGQRGRVRHAAMLLHGTREKPHYLTYPKRYKNEELIADTLDPLPEYLEEDIQGNGLNNFGSKHSQSHFIINDLFGIPVSRGIDYFMKMLQKRQV